MDMSPTSQPKFHSTDGRRADRRSYDAQIQFRKGVKRAMVKLQDISQLGARVAWVSQFEFGCEFLRPLNPVVLESIIARR